MRLPSRPGLSRRAHTWWPSQVGLPVFPRRPLGQIRSRRFRSVGAGPHQCHRLTGLDHRRFGRDGRRGGFRCRDRNLLYRRRCGRRNYDLLLATGCKPNQRYPQQEYCYIPSNSMVVSYDELLASGRRHSDAARPVFGRNYEGRNRQSAVATDARRVCVHGKRTSRFFCAFARCVSEFEMEESGIWWTLPSGELK